MTGPPSAAGTYGQDSDGTRTDAPTRGARHGAAATGSDYGLDVGAPLAAGSGGAHGLGEDAARAGSPGGGTFQADLSSGEVAGGSDSPAGGTLPEPTLPLAAELVGRGEEARARVPTLDTAVGIVLARWANAADRRRAAVLAEGERLRASGLWEARYRESYGKVLARLEQDGDPDPEETLLSAATEQRTTVFHRVAQSAPDLCRRLG
jgi:hypothetical protein